MAFTEEVFKNKGGLFGGHTGMKYNKSDTEDIGGILWSKPCHYQPGEVSIQVTPPDKIEEPHEYMEKD
jgi:hypothetical protein